MTDHVDKLKATVGELEQELRSLPSVEGEAREVLKQALREIHAALQEDESEELEHQSIMDRLNDAALEFEESHPTLAGIISRLIDGLGQMGI